MNDSTLFAYTAPVGTPDAGLYLPGQVARLTTTAFPTTDAAQYSQRDYNYARYHGAVLTRTDLDVDTTSTTLPITYTTYALGGHGETLSATITDGSPRITVTVH